MSDVRLANLRCEYQENPLGIGELCPRLSWQLEAAAGERGVMQSAYQVLVASTPERLSADQGDVWDSGRVKSSQNSQVEYAGQKPASRKQYYWKVRVWDQDGTASPWSKPACWEMGLLRPADWKGQWISGRNETSPKEGLRCPYVRKSFRLDGKVVQARAYVTARGLYELQINGRRVGQDYFTPGWTDYDIRVQYQTYDVTDLLQAEANAVGAILGEGWCCGNLPSPKNRNVYDDVPKLLCQLEIQYDDGRTEMIVTDDSWTTAEGPILISDIYSGETYDQRLEMPGWSEADFDDKAWQPVRVAKVEKKAKLVASASPRVRQTNELTPVSVTWPTPGTFIVDMGQNMVGWVRLNIPAGAKPGTEITVRHAEVLNSDGMLYTDNLRSAKCTDQYILAGGAATLEPHFTFHGFRYVELTGFPGKPTVESLRGIVLHSDTPPAGTFECSNDMLNQLQHNILWGQKGNFLDVPTDCPQRDERLGWTGDAQVFVRTACYNMDVAGFFTKWLTDLDDAQSSKGAYPSVAPGIWRNPGRHDDGGPAWADAGIVCPWTIYLCYGDRRILRQHYTSMVRYMKYQDKVDWTSRHCFGDWLNLNDPTAKNVIGYAFWAYTTAIMIEVARILGKAEDAAKYRAQLREIKRTFCREFVTSTGRLVSQSQTAYILAIQFDLLTPQLRAKAAEHFVAHVHSRGDHLSTGFVGTPYILDALTAVGELDLAYKLLLNNDYPSWGYTIRLGATTMWEHWDSLHHKRGLQDPKMNSFNHYAYGAVGDWMYRTIGGIGLDARRPGYRHAVIHPRPGGKLKWAKAGLQTPNGLLVCDWKLKGKTLSLNVTVPPNATATVYVPAGKATGITESGKPAAKSPGVEFVKYADGAAMYQIGSGQYRFIARQ